MHHLVRATHWRRSLAVVASGVIVSLIAWWTSVSADRAAVLQELQNRARLHAQILDTRFSDLEHPVISAADFVAADHDVIAADFERFAMFVISKNPPVLWLAWVAVVRRADRAAFESAAQHDRPGFRIQDRLDGGGIALAPQRDEYLPLYAGRWLQPGTIPYGLDLAADPVQRGAAARARDEGRVIAAGPMTDLDSGGRRDIITVIAPIFPPEDAKPHDVASRRKALAGYVISAYTLDAVLAYVSAGVMGPGETVSFARETPAVGPGLSLAVQVADAHAAEQSRLSRPLKRGSYRSVQPLLLSGEPWVASFVFAPEAIASRGSDAPYGWLGAGLMLTAMLGTMTARGEMRRFATERLVVTRTHELSAANERLHHSAEMLQATLEAAPLGIIALDAEGRISLWNYGAERIFGYVAADVLGLSYIDLVVPEELRPSAKDLHARIQLGEHLRDVEARRQRRDGTPLEIRVAGNPLRDATGALRGAVFANQDITESRKLEDQLRQAQKMEAIGQLTGGVAHDFNNLLGTAITSLDLLREMLQNEPDKDELAEHALDALLHGADLIRRLLAFARRQPLQPECLQLNDLVVDAVRLFRPLLGDAIDVLLDLGDALWLVLVDRAQFETTLINLATNARDAMSHGGRLSIATRNARVGDANDVGGDVPPGEYVSVEVRDTGIGMPPALLQRIFEPFFTTKGKTVGTGLGLSMVLGFIKQSGGHLTVDSEEGHGTCFRLYLCRHHADASIAAPPVGRVAADRTPAMRDARVLVVEDSSGLRRIVMQQLVRFGYRVIEAADAGAALAILESGRHIDLLFTDVILPGGMSGVELATIARARWPDLRILLTSGFPEMLVERGLAPAGLRLLQKPYREETLARALREALAG